ncbi:hypothetical protein [Microbulbifer sp. 2205BS26-8]|uniref:hypothetical protein n=1 Tax=Microbulbifer sp. 2205BS26-8 TaxID=3064386 RepID=UPI00273DCC14|nr:hypothetical protein [Microbulbifer sp. 2205BS26-8]MDP5211119.1 hypothetical protein [Microbulbifer sp. 2205BS26-8]
MNIKKRILKLGIFLVLSFAGLMVVANTLSYKQTSCKYRPESKYIWIKFDNGVQEKGVRFVSDGVIFDSSIIGRTYAKDYPDITRVAYGKGKGGLGLLTVEFMEGGQLEREKVGNIDEQCWKNLKTLLAANPLSRKIEIFDEGGASRQSLN